jgi:hypothetical protein
MSSLLILIIFHSTQIGYASEIIELDSGLRIRGQETREYNNMDIIIKGDISIDENASLSFHGCNLTILWLLGSDKPHIGVSGNGSLLLENCNLLLRLDQISGYSTNGKIIIQNNGVFYAKNTSIQSTSDVIMWFLDDSRGSFINASYSGEASESNLHWSLEDMLPDPVLREYFDDYSIRCEDSTEVEIIESSIGKLNVYENSTCRIESSKLSYLNPNSLVTTFASESKVKILTLTQRNQNTKLTGSYNGFYSEWNSQEQFGLESDTNIFLKDTSFDHLWLSLFNCTSVIEDADLWLVTMYRGELSLDDTSVWLLRASYGNATLLESEISYLIAERDDGELHVDGCNVGWLGLTALSRETQYHKIAAKIENSSIESCMVNYWIVPFEVDVSFSNVVFQNLSMRPAPIFEAFFNDCKVKDTVTLYRMSPEYNLHVRGSLELLGVVLNDYPNTLLTREYQVQVVLDDKPVEEVEVQIFRDEEIWKTGATDKNGTYLFEVLWVNYTLRDHPFVSLENPVNNLTSSIVVKVKDYYGQKHVSALSSTPIIVYIHARQEYMLEVAILLVFTICSFLYFIVRKSSY